MHLVGEPGQREDILPVGVHALEGPLPFLLCVTETSLLDEERDQAAIVPGVVRPEFHGLAERAVRLLPADAGAVQIEPEIMPRVGIAPIEAINALAV